MSEAAIVSVPASDFVAMRRELSEIMQRLNEALAGVPKLPDDATAALVAREAAKARGWYKAAEFAAVIGRCDDWVTARCAARVIKTLPGGKPWRIPLSEEARWNALQN